MANQYNRFKAKHIALMAVMCLLGSGLFTSCYEIDDFTASHYEYHRAKAEIELYTKNSDSWYANQAYVTLNYNHPDKVELCTLYYDEHDYQSDVPFDPNLDGVMCQKVYSPNQLAINYLKLGTTYRFVACVTDKLGNSTWSEEMLYTTPNLNFKIKEFHRWWQSDNSILTTVEYETKNDLMGITARGVQVAESNEDLEKGNLVFDGTETHNYVTRYSGEVVMRNLEPAHTYYVRCYLVVQGVTYYSKVSTYTTPRQ